MAGAQTFVRAQVSSITIKDLILVPDLKSERTDSTNNYFKLLLKVSNVSTASSMYLKYGTVADSADILNKQEQFVHQGTVDYITYNGQQYSLINYNVTIPVVLPKTYFPAMKYLTVYVEDANQQISNKLYFNFN
jgi:hypothetical protein